MKKLFFIVIVITLFTISVEEGLFADGHVEKEASSPLYFTIIHSSDGESGLLMDDYSGSVAQFATAVKDIVDEVGVDNSLVVSSGDNFLAGVIYAASEGIYDARALSHIGVEVSAIGNHEFDFGPEGLERFIVNSNFLFINSNLDFTNEVALRRFAGIKILDHAILEKGGRKIGLIGATTEALSYISSPGNVIINDVRDSLQRSADRLRAQGVDIIIALTHLQNIEEEKRLAAEIRGVDIFVAGGGDDLIGNENNSYLVRKNRDGEDVRDAPSGEYPFRTLTPDGEPVVVVSTDGSYNYVGRLDVEFDDRGAIVSIGNKSGPVAVYPDIAPDSRIQEEIVDVVTQEIEDFNTLVVGRTTDGLDGTRASVRTGESTMGNAITDGYLYATRQYAEGLEVDFAFTNGGGIRNSIVIQRDSAITKRQLLDALPFANYLTVINGMTAGEIKALFEHSIAELPEAGGRFLQVSGISVTYNSGLQVGSRVQSIRIGDETIVSEGEVVSTESYSAITNSFLADGGDGYAVLSEIPQERKINSGYSYAEGFELYLKDNSPISSPIGGRLIDVGN